MKVFLFHEFALQLNHIQHLIQQEIKKLYPFQQTFVTWLHLHCISSSKFDNNSNQATKFSRYYSTQLQASTLFNGYNLCFNFINLSSILYFVIWLLKGLPNLLHCCEKHRSPTIIWLQQASKPRHYPWIFFIPCNKVRVFWAWYWSN